MNFVIKIFRSCMAASLVGSAALFCYYNFSLPSESLQHHHHHDEEEEHNDDKVAFTDLQRKQHGVNLQRINGGVLKKTITSPGMITINTNTHTHLVPKVAGIVSEAYKNIGDMVVANELLAILESREMAEAKSSYLAELKKERLTSQTFVRETALFEKQVSTEQAYQEALAVQEESLIRLEMAKQKLQVLSLSLDEINYLSQEETDSLRRYEMKAPIGGTIIQRHLSNGEFVNTDHEAYEIADLSNVWLEFDLYPHEISLINRGQQVKFKDSNGKEGMGEIIHISPTLDVKTRKGFAIAQIENSQHMWHPGLFVDVLVPTEEKKVGLMVPKNAIQKIDGQDCLFVQSIPGEFEVRPIALGECDNTHIEILSGLKVGEKIATDKTFILKAELKKHEAEHMD